MITPTQNRFAVLIGAAEHLIEQQRYNDAVALVTFEANLSQSEAQSVLALIIARLATIVRLAKEERAAHEPAHETSEPQ